MGLDNIREGMSSVMNTLKWEYTNVVTAKLNPSETFCCNVMYICACIYIFFV